jgi:putative endonuclease
MFYVYILKSLSSGVYYVGMAKDIQVRLKEHNSGKSKFTKGHLPFELVYQEGPFPA